MPVSAKKEGLLQKNKALFKILIKSENLNFRSLFLLISQNVIIIATHNTSTILRKAVTTVIKPLKNLTMRRMFLAIIVLFTVAFLVSCARGISPEQAANGKARCGKNYIR